MCLLAVRHPASGRRRCAPLEGIPSSGPGEVTQDGVDDVGLRDHRDDLHRRSARGAQERINLEDAPEQSSPTGPGGRGAWLRVRAPPSSGSSTNRSAPRTTTSSEVWGDTVVITHPCHPLTGREVAVVRVYRRDGERPSLVIRLPDGTPQCVPLAWTNRATPDPHMIGARPAARLSGLALLEVLDRLDRWREGP